MLLFCLSLSPRLSLCLKSVGVSSGEDLKKKNLVFSIGGWGSAESQLYALSYPILYKGTLASVDFVIHGSPGTNPPWLPRDNYS